jgi:hypothetical protein
VWFAWADNGEALVVQGKPDLKGVLWRVDANGGKEALPELQLLRNTDTGIQLRFDVHPDGRRIVLEAPEVLEADLGLIENVR